MLSMTCTAFPSALLTSPHDDLSGRLEEFIVHRACGQIRDLRVICQGQRVVLQGRSRTYHAKQLALEAALDVLGTHPALVNEIVVC